MNRFFKKTASILAVALAGFTGMQATAASWPANYQGVMLQGFYWDAYKSGGGYGTTKWADLTRQADELSKYFKLIWVPNAARANGENGGGNGYMPIYWFTNYNCAYGTEAELKTMIDTYKAKGTGFIEDCVINHRVGVSNWYNFPTETWKQTTYTMSDGSICSTDEMWRTGGQGCPWRPGAPDEGEDFDGARDLDHTNGTVQAHCKDYVKYLTTDRGFVGLRYDMTKGYSGYYNGMYNSSANVQFSVGEFFDGNYDLVKRWIDQTAEYNNGAGKSAAFDFPCKYAMNEAFGSNDMRKLSWAANGVTPQPAGMIHYGYQQFAVTFVDNHDTFRDGSKFPSDQNIMAANAFILFSPGTPCIFWPHYYANKTAMQALIQARNDVGIHNMSSVKVVKLENNCYAAEITGTKGTAVVKIGSDMSFSPGGNYTIKASGTNYCVWTNVGGNGNGGGGGDTGSSFTVYFDNSQSKWATPYIHYWGASESSWPGVAMTKVSGDVWSYTVPAGTTGILFNAGDGDATKTSDFVAQANHIYSTSGDQGVYNGNGNGGGGGGDTGSSFTVYFDNSQSKWATPYIHYWGASESSWPGVAMTKVNGDVWSYTVPAGTTGILFNAGDGDATKTSDFVAQPNHIYTTSGDQGVYNGNGGGGGGNDTGTSFNVYFDNTPSQWATPYIHHWGSTETDWPGAAMSKHKDNVWVYTVPAGTTGLLFNAGDGDATKTEDFVAMPNHLYTTSGDQGVYSDAGNGGGGGNGNNPGTAPAQLYMIGNVDGAGWATNKGTLMTKSGDIFSTTVTIDDAGEGVGYFSFCETLSSVEDDWDPINGANRYGAPTSDFPVENNKSYDITTYAVNVDAMGCQSWMIPSGKYSFKVDFSNMKLSIGTSSLVDNIFSDFDGETIFFNLQGQKMTEPLQPGIYIRVRAGKSDKVLVK